MALHSTIIPLLIEKTFQLFLMLFCFQLSSQISSLHHHQPLEITAFITKLPINGLNILNIRGMNHDMTVVIGVLAVLPLPFIKNGFILSFFIEFKDFFVKNI